MPLGKNVKYRVKTTNNSIVPASDGNTYFFNNDGKIYKRTSEGKKIRLAFKDGKVVEATPLKKSAKKGKKK